MKTLYSFQVENVDAGAKRHLLIADDCGLGKTLSAVEIGKACRAASYKTPLGVPWRALIVCPKGVRFQWLREITEQDPNAPSKIVELDDEIGLGADGWHIMHYEALMRTPPTHVLWDLVVCDEAHRLRNRKNISTKAIKLLSSLRRIALTGTPMDKDPSEMWSIWNWLYPGEFTSYWRFRERYCLIQENYAGYPTVVGPKNVDALAKQLKGRFMKHTKEMVAPQLPPKIFVNVPLHMEGEQLHLYETIRKSKDIEVTTAKGDLIIPSALAKLVRLQQVASAPVSLGEEFAMSSVKVDWTLEFIGDHPELSIVVFTKFVATSELILTKLKEGSVPAEGFFGNKATAPVDFLNGDARVLVATIAKAGEGLDLKRTNAAIFVDQDWSTLKMQQAYDRIHRLGIDAPKMLYILSCSPIDQLVQDAIDKKWDDTTLVYEAIQRHMIDKEDT